MRICGGVLWGVVGGFGWLWGVVCCCVCLGGVVWCGVCWCGVWSGGLSVAGRVEFWVVMLGRLQSGCSLLRGRARYEF